MAQSKTGLIKFLGMNAQGDLGPLTTYTSRFGHLVYYPRNPALNPPSEEQTAQRLSMREAAAAWRARTPAERADWTALGFAAHLRITGYNLFTYWQMTGDFETVQTLINRTGIVVS